MLCPVCNAENQPLDWVFRTYEAPYGPVVGYRFEVVTCSICHESAATGRTDAEQAIAESDRASVRNIMAFFAASDISIPYLNRVLKVPVSDMERWTLTGECSPGERALLQTVRRFPWILKTMG